MQILSEQDHQGLTGRAGEQEKNTHQKTSLTGYYMTFNITGKKEIGSTDCRNITMLNNISILRQIKHSADAV